MFARHRLHYFIRFKPKYSDESVQYLSTFSAAKILSNDNRKRCITLLQEMKPIRVKVSDNPVTKAAVLVPLCMVRKELSLLYTLRSSDLKSYRGQVAFPGGKYDTTDTNLAETALRETYEELGITKERIDLWGHGNAVGTVSKEMSVLPYIGYINGELNLNELKLNPQEVESVFSVPLKVLCNPLNCRYTQFRDSYTLPVYLGGEHRIWGMTAIITHLLLSALLPDLYKHKFKFIRPVTVKSN